MKDTFINFSHLKLNEAPVPPREVEAAGSERAKAGSTAQREGTNKRREAQQFQMSTQTGQASKDMNTSTRVTEHLEVITQEKEYLRKVQSLKSDWRTELSEELGEQQPEEPEHPYVKVMPNIHYKQIEAQKELAAAGKASVKKGLKESDQSTVKRSADHLKKSLDQAKIHARKAEQQRNLSKTAAEDGDEKKAIRAKQEADKETRQVIQHKKDATEYDPAGSDEYADRSNPGLVTAKYKRDLGTSSGRRNIVTARDR